MASSRKAPVAAPSPRAVEERDAVVIRFAGDSGDGVQLMGSQFTAASAAAGNDISTLPDFPAEIRAPAGSLAGVSGFQVHFSKNEIHTPGDGLDALVAMNPAALAANLRDLQPGGILLINADAFSAENLSRAGYAANPLEDGSLSAYRVIALPMNKLHRAAVEKVKLIPREVDRCRNFFALGLVYWIYERPLEPTLHWIQDKFAKNPAMLEANTRALKAGYHHGETAHFLPAHYRVAKAHIPPGRYRKITGNEALAVGLVAASRLCELPLVFAAHPITPASDVLHHLIDMKKHGVRVVQAEDELAALSVAIGASFAGALGATATSGPGMSLMTEGLGLAVISELPCVIIDVQRAGPSTGLPTKTEQADLLQALFGRHGEAPLPVLAPAHPSDCFHMALEAARLAIRLMTPVVLLSDAYLANGAEPWRIPKASELAKIEVRRLVEGTARGNRETGIRNQESRVSKQEGFTHEAPGAGSGAALNGEFRPYDRDADLVRPWATPGTPGLEHRVGGLEKEAGTGNVSYDHDNHEALIRQRAEKIARVADDIPPLQVQGPPQGELLVIGWGSTHGAIVSAVERCRREGLAVSCACLRYLNPLPRNTGEALARFRRVLVPELNAGQLAWLLRGRFLIEVESLSKIQGRPFLVSEIEAKIRAMVVSMGPAARA